MLVSQPGYVYLKIKHKGKRHELGISYISWDGIDDNGGPVVKFEIEDIDGDVDISDEVIKTELQKYLDAQ